MKNKFAVNWNILSDDYTKTFWDQNIRQFWIDEEIPLSDDKITWMSLHKEEKELYKLVLGGLTLLDTEQGSTGMPNISKSVDNLQHKAVLSYMGFMEHMHAKSYSSIFSTLCTNNEINKIFEDVEKHKILQNKLSIILSRYQNITNKETLYLAMACSVFLETFMFYSGFFYPLYLAGQGKLVNSGEIINLIIRDEAVHGLFTGVISRDLLKTFSDKTIQKLKKDVINILEELVIEEKKYTKELYEPVGLVLEVEKFSEYNADKALMNLGYDTLFDVDEMDINSVVLTGLRTDTKNHDFFSTKGNGYIKTTKSKETLNDDDFDF